MNLWLEQQAALLREGRFAELDLANLIEEIEAMARKDRKAVKNNLVVLLTHLFKHLFQPRGKPEPPPAPGRGVRARLR